MANPAVHQRIAPAPLEKFYPSQTFAALTKRFSNLGAFS
jgi:hypothetical protein